MAASIDPFLLPLLDATDEGAEATALEELIALHTRPWIRRVIQMKFGAGSRELRENVELSEIEGDVVAALIEKLRACKAERDTVSIASWGGYVKRTAENKCDDYLRHRHPQRYRLKYRLRFLFEDREDWAIWTVDNSLRCGPDAWRVRSIRCSSSRYRRLLDVPPPVAFVARTADNLDAEALLEIVSQIFQWADGPLDLDEVVNIVATQYRVTDLPLASTDDPHLAVSIAETPNASASHPLSRLLHQEYLVWLWSEICELPLAQRVALLLNCGDELSQFPAYGVATIRQIAEVLGRDPLEFARLWPQLPLNDAAIAAELGIPRQKVINLRKSARERLKRRLGKGGAQSAAR
jgi:hypothetical protein